MRAAAYARFSTDKQYETSIETQLRDIRQYCKRKGYHIVKEYVDRAESASKFDRPAFQKMLEDARKHLFDVVIVHKLNRLARDRYLSVVTAHELKKYGVSVESVLEPVDDSPVGQLLWGILDAVNEFERLNTIQEIKMKMRPLAEKGFWMGGRVPFGFSTKKVSVDGKMHTILKVNEEEAVIVRRIFDMFISGLSFKKIATTLNSEGILNRGKPWLPGTISSIVKNPRYVGKHFWSKGTKTRHNIVREDAIFIDGPSIVDPKTWEKAQQRLKTYIKTKPAKYNYVLKGKAHCECGAPLWGTMINGFPNYRCKHYSEDPRSHVSISAKKLESHVLGYIEKLLRENVDFEKLTASLNELKRMELGHSEKLAEELEYHQRAIENLISNLEQLPKNAQKHILERIQEHSTAIEKIKRNLASSNVKFLTVDEVKEKFATILAIWRKDATKVVSYLIEKVVVYKMGYIEIVPKFAI